MLLSDSTSCRVKRFRRRASAGAGIGSRCTAFLLGPGYRRLPVWTQLPQFGITISRVHHMFKFSSALLAASLIPSAATAELRVGAAKRTITPDLAKHGPVYMAGFGQNRKATGVHDDLYARCIAFSSGARPLVFCGVDLIGLFWDDVQKIRRNVNADL